MDDATVSAAIATRFEGITAPTGEDALALVTDELPDQLGPTPCLLVYVDDEDLEWGPSKLRHGQHTYTAQFLRRQSGDFASRMSALSAWRPKLRDQIVGQIQLGLTYVDWASLVRIERGEVSYAGIAYDALNLTVRVKTRETVTAAA